MKTVLIILIPAIYWIAMVRLLRRYYIQKKLSPGYFALIVAGGISGTTFVLYYTAIMASGVDLGLGTLSLGTIIALINFFIAYPIIYFSYRGSGN